VLGLKGVLYGCRQIVLRFNLAALNSALLRMSSKHSQAHITAAGRATGQDEPTYGFGRR